MVLWSAGETRRFFDAVGVAVMGAVWLEERALFLGVAGSQRDGAA